jgi:hypothetical protein
VKHLRDISIGNIKLNCRQLSIEAIHWKYLIPLKTINQKNHEKIQILWGANIICRMLPDHLWVLL